MGTEKPLSFLKKYWVKSSMDLPYFLILLVILAVGLVMLLSSSYFHAFYNVSGENTELFYFWRQLFFVGIGLVALFVVSKLDYHILKNLSIVAMAIAIFLLVIVLFMPSEDGIRRWIDFKIFQLQPSEVAKFALILYLARGLDKDYKKLTSTKLSKLPAAHSIYEMSGKKILITQGTTTLFYYLIIVTFIAGLVALESHLSGTILVMGVGVIMLWLGEGRARWFVIGAVLAISLVAFVVIICKAYDFENVPILRQYMVDRIQAWLDKDFEPTGKRWQTNQSLYAIGSGGFFGAGLGNSKEKYLYVSEPHNDFIFSIVSEELGFVGATAILVVFGILIWRGITIGMHARDRFGALITFGMVLHLGLQIALNVAVVTDTLPNTGIGFPFFSYGGSSMIICLVEMGVVLSVSRQSNMPKLYSFQKGKKTSRKKNAVNDYE